MPDCDSKVTITVFDELELEQRTKGFSDWVFFPYCSLWDCTTLDFRYVNVIQSGRPTYAFY